MTAKATLELWFGCFVLCTIISCTISAPPVRVQGNPYPFYQSPDPDAIDPEGLALEQPEHERAVKRNPAPPVECAQCCNNFWCSYVDTRCLCTPQWNIGP